MKIVVGPAIEKDSIELVPDWTKADLDVLKETYASMDWDDALKDMSGLEAWEFFRNFMDEETEKHVPNKLRRVGTSPLWMKKNILTLVRKKEGCGDGTLGMGVRIMTAFRHTRKSRRRCKRG